MFCLYLCLFYVYLGPIDAIEWLRKIVMTCSSIYYWYYPVLIYNTAMNSMQPTD
jgi:hypothetical protein